MLFILLTCLKLYTFLTLDCQSSISVIMRAFILTPDVSKVIMSAKNSFKEKKMEPTSSAAVVEQIQIISAGWPKS